MDPRILAELDTLSEEDVLRIAGAFGGRQQKKNTAINFLATQDESHVLEALRALKEARGAPQAAAGAEERKVPFVCEGKLSFIYNRAYEIPAGEIVELPESVALHAAGVARAKALHFRCSVI